MFGKVAEQSQDIEVSYPTQPSKEACEIVNKNTIIDMLEKGVTPSQELVDRVFFACYQYAPGDTKDGLGDIMKFALENLLTPSQDIIDLFFSDAYEKDFYAQIELILKNLFRPGLKSINQVFIRACKDERKEFIEWMKENKLEPSRVVIKKAVTDADEDGRKEFKEWMTTKGYQDKDFVDRLLSMYAKVRERLNS